MVVKTEEKETQREKEEGRKVGVSLILFEQMKKSGTRALFG